MNRRAIRYPSLTYLDHVIPGAAVYHLAPDLHRPLVYGLAVGPDRASASAAEVDAITAAARRLQGDTTMTTQISMSEEVQP